MSEREWLHRFIACTPFGADAPAEDIANAERILSALERELAEYARGVESWKREEAIWKEQEALLLKRIDDARPLVGLLRSEYEDDDAVRDRCDAWARREP
jgi:hypothetical protein